MTHIRRLSEYDLKRPVNMPGTTCAGFRAAKTIHGRTSTAFPMNWSRRSTKSHQLPRPISMRRHLSFGVAEVETPARGLRPDLPSGGDSVNNTYA